MAGGALAVLLAACGPAGPPLPSDALDHAIARHIGDPDTCVLIADAASGRVLYQYGEDFNCTVTLPACDRPGQLSARKALAFARGDGAREKSCASNADGSRTVGWSEGAVASQKRKLIYSAVMEGERALPGEEISARLAQAFTDAGL
jgi:hypothetical protein